MTLCMGLVVLGSRSIVGDYNDDLTGVSKPVSALSNGGNVVASGEMTVQEFRRGVRHDKTHYVDL
jgi:hypothetical protein